MAYTKIVHNSRNVQTVYFDAAAGWEQWFLLVSDQHHDSISCARKLEKEHLDLALERNAYIISAGDTFDLCQGKFDPRKTFIGLRPEYLDAMNKKGGEGYINAVVDDAVEFYKPYAHLMLVIGKGNHDTTYAQRHGTDVISAMVSKLNSTISGGHVIQTGGYGGWVRFNFSSNKSNRSSLRLKYFHGSGGDAPVTRGAIQTARQAVYLEADIILNGHNHNSYHIPISREKLSDSGKVVFDIMDFVRTPGYNCGYGDGNNGWEAEKMPPKPIGCTWMRFFYGDKIQREFTASVKGG